MSLVRITREGGESGPYLTIKLVSDGGFSVSWKNLWRFRIRGRNRGDLNKFIVRTTSGSTERFTNSLKTFPNAQGGTSR